MIIAEVSLLKCELTQFEGDAQIHLRFSVFGEIFRGGKQTA
jgi:hypothetical protein